jgi:hypothetical protein
MLRYQQRKPRLGSRDDIRDAEREALIAASLAYRDLFAYQTDTPEPGAGSGGVSA